MRQKQLNGGFGITDFKHIFDSKKASFDIIETHVTTLPRSQNVIIKSPRMCGIRRPYPQNVSAI